jgi:RNA polymerase sigma factor for flagellar operon FliA
MEICIARRPPATPPPPPVRPRRLAKRQRDAVITSHLVLVDQIAAKLRARLPEQVEVADLVSAGYVGLVEAAGAFDAARGVAFSAFARRRILGAMLDHLREVDPLSRNGRARVRAGLSAHFEVQLHLDDPIHAQTYGLGEIVSGLPAPDTGTATRLRAASIQAALARLPERERYVVEQYFWRERTLGDIGRDFNVSESRVQQLKKQGCAMLRRLLTC